MTATGARIAGEQFEKDRRRLLALLVSKNGSSQWSSVKTRMRMGSDAFAELVDGMVESGALRVEKGPGNGYLVLPGFDLITSENQLLSTSDVAERCGVTEMTVRRWLRTGVLHGIKPTSVKQGAYRIASSEVDRMLGSSAHV